MIDRETIDRILATANIVDVVSDFVQLKKKGTNYTACCPFHSEKTPSFMVSPARGIFKCFGCGKAGSAVNFVMEHERMQFIEAIRWLARKYGIPIEEKELTAEEKARQGEYESMMILTDWAKEYFMRQLKTGDGLTVGMTYFKQRGFTDQTITEACLGYCPEGGKTMTDAALKAGYRSEFLLATGLSLKNETTGELYDRFRGRIMFPIFSISGRVIGFGGRTLRTDKKVAKYQNSPESEIYHKSNSLYGIYLAKQAITSKDRCILVEGYADVLQMHQRGIKNVIASSGTSLTKEQVQTIKRFTSNVTIIYDGDDAGIHAALRGIDLVLEAGMNVNCVLLPDGKDPDDFAKENNITYIEGFIEKNSLDFIDFKTKMLIGSDTENLERRREAIKSITESIALIPDAITRALYVKTCAERLGMKESVIENDISQKRAALIDGQQGREVWQNSKKRQEIQQKSLITKPGNIENIQKAQKDELEREIIYYLVKYGNNCIEVANPSDPNDLYTFEIRDFILHELDIDHITLSIPACSEIVSMALKHREEGTELQAQEMICSPNPDVSKIIGEILFSEDPWSESDDDEEEGGRVREFEMKSNLSITVPKMMALYKAAYITSKITELTHMVEELDKEGRDEESLEMMGNIRELATARAILMEKYQRIL